MMLAQTDFLGELKIILIGSYKAIAKKVLSQGEQILTCLLFTEDIFDVVYVLLIYTDTDEGGEH
ncbi:hypothetical protein SAMN04515674_1043 [Pseudarcicella hirudinis]|uniref:Uncharacterized protein n=1 Tax=Pseudarcicella hirudinis TaxID=1079859 RepID=A0A1I5RDJ1_9BACT|nr:hypothetical protein SAMN04515674_1043 [Pseudarcicella hirudinis]